jgi:hypothetical protein
VAEILGDDAEAILSFLEAENAASLAELVAAHPILAATPADRPTPW